MPLPSALPAWQPLLEGRLGVRARSIIDRIVLSLEHQPPSDRPGFLGDASAALLLAYCDRPDASSKLEAALQVTTMTPATISLYSGISGISWLVNHLLDEDEADPIVAHLDEAVFRYLDTPTWSERYDLITGLVGVGVSAASRRSSAAVAIAESVLNHLGALAISGDAGTTWRTPVELLVDARRKEFPHGVFDLGVAHGVPGVIGMLARFLESGLFPERSRQLLHSSVKWLLRTIPDGQPRFGTNWPSERPEVKRIGWCYGDVGVAGVLLAASRALQSPELENQALSLLLRASVPLATRTIPDACFCHGSAGLAHIYNIAFQRTGDPRLLAEAMRWLIDVIDREEHHVGVGGYRFLKATDAGATWTPDSTLASGETGVALVLLAAVEDRIPDWQSLFLL